MPTASPDPHNGHPALHEGPDSSAARLTIILVHGRGGSAADMIALSAGFHTADVAYIAPQAAGSSWYPYSFLQRIEDNEPELGSALRVIDALIHSLDERHLADRVGLIGFSQGACLALEYAARHPRRYAAIAGLSGGLIGPPGTPRHYPGTFDRAPVLLGCSDIDPHIPLERVHESARVFEAMGATVDERIYPRMGHTINRDELDAVTALLTRA